MEKIIYGYYDSEFGQMIIAQTDIGICWIGFMVDNCAKGDGLSLLYKRFSNVEFMRSDTVGKSLGETVINAWRADMPFGVNLDLRGTDFQKQVWKSLLNIDKGSTSSYAEIAEDIGRPKSHRAVGTAIGQNPVSLIVPCHRVIQKNGVIGNYLWGKEIKRQILKEEGVYL